MKINGILMLMYTGRYVKRKIPLYKRIYNYIDRKINQDYSKFFGDIFSRYFAFLLGLIFGFYWFFSRLIDILA